jgi:hypothetical protein
VRFLHAIISLTALTACTAASMSVAPPTSTPAPPVSTTCSAREVASNIEWRMSDVDDARELSRWCRAVGSPVFVAMPVATAAPLPLLDEFVVISWNAHLAEGELDDLIAKLRSGALTGGRPVAHFALLVQELYRRGDSVPEFDRRDRSAFAIRARDPESPDIDDYAASLGLSMLAATRSSRPSRCSIRSPWSCRWSASAVSHSARPCRSRRAKARSASN